MWGNHRAYNEEGEIIYDTAIGVTAGYENHIGNLNPYRYRSYYYDSDIGLYYLQSRYYDPQIGRFISQDSVEYLDPETINGLNLYSYCGNNPVMFTDPLGTTKWWEWLIAGVVVAGLIVGSIFTGGLLGAAFLGAAIGGGISLGTQAISGELNWGQFALDIGVGALTGAIGGSGISRLGSTFVGIGIGGFSNVGSQLISGKSFREINWWSVGISAIIGGIAGAIGGAGAKNKAKMDKFILKNPAVIKAQNSVSKVGEKLANGLYATAQGGKSAYTQVMNRMSNAIFNAASMYSKSALTWALSSYGISSILLSGLSFIPGW